MYSIFGASKETTVNIMLRDTHNFPFIDWFSSAIPSNSSPFKRYKVYNTIYAIQCNVIVHVPRVLILHRT